MSLASILYNSVPAAKEELSIGGISFTTVDLGGHMTARRVWKDYFPAVDAIVYIIDAFDRERFSESKDELDVRFSVFYNSCDPFSIQYFL